MFEFVAGGGAREIGASFYVLRRGDTYIGFDCGLRPKVDRNDPERLFKLTPYLDVCPKLDYLFLTHGHLDHDGDVPELFRKFENLKVFATPETFHMAQLHWEETLRIGARERMAMPFDRRDAELAKRSVYSLVPHQRMEFTREGFSVTAIPAGHILGAVSYEFVSAGTRVFVTGDISLTDQETVDGAVVSGRADILISEATHGMKTCVPRDQEKNRFLLDVMFAIARGGHVLIPSFSIGRAQEIFEMLRKSPLLAGVPIHLDGATKQVSELYQRYVPERVHTDISRHFVPDWAARNKILSGPPCVVIASSGMLDGGISVAYAQKWLGRQENAIFFPGYIDPCSPGAKVLECGENGLVSLGEPNGESGLYTCRAETGRYHFSAHADATDLARLRAILAPKLTILVHGDSEGMDTIIREEGRDGSIIAPHNGEVVSLA